MRIPERFEEILRQQCRFVDPDQPLDLDATLQSLGVDSLGLVTLTMQLEEAYEIELPDSALPALTVTPVDLWAAFDRALAAGRAS